MATPSARPHYLAALQQGRINATRPAAELSVGDFIELSRTCDKQCDIEDWFDWAETGTGRRLCRIVEMHDVDDLPLYDWMWECNELPTHRGGDVSDDARDLPTWLLTADEIASFYGLVTIFRDPAGRFIAVNREGYDYWREVFLPMDWRNLFANELEKAKIAKAKRKAEAAERERRATAEMFARIAKERAEIAARCDGLRRNPTTVPRIKRNVAALMEGYGMPAGSFKVEVKKCGYGERHITVTPTDCKNDELIQLGLDIVSELDTRGYIGRTPEGDLYVESLIAPWIGDNARVFFN